MFLYGTCFSRGEPLYREKQFVNVFCSRGSRKLELYSLQSIQLPSFVADLHLSWRNGTSEPQKLIFTKAVLKIFFFPIFDCQILCSGLGQLHSLTYLSSRVYNIFEVSNFNRPQKEFIVDHLGLIIWTKFTLPASLTENIFLASFLDFRTSWPSCSTFIAFICSSLFLTLSVI